MTPAHVEVTKNIKNVAVDNSHNYMGVIQINIMGNYFCLIFFILLSLTACSDSNINIPNKQSIGFSKTLVAIYSPENGSTLSINRPVIIDYEVLRGIKTSYVKIQVDKSPPLTVVNIKGRHHINALSEGPHTIMVSEYRSDGKASGSQAVIRIKVE
jgi:hypothetical protein